jgi:hypothetical protein
LLQVCLLFQIDSNSLTRSLALHPLTSIGN